MRNQRDRTVKLGDSQRRPLPPAVIGDGDGRPSCLASSDPVDVMLLVSGSALTSFPPLLLMVPVSPSESSPQYAAEDEEELADAQLPLAWAAHSAAGPPNKASGPPGGSPPMPPPPPLPKARVSQLRPCCMVWMLSWEPEEQEVQEPRPLSAASRETRSPWSWVSSSELGEERTVGQPV